MTEFLVVLSACLGAFCAYLLYKLRDIKKNPRYTVEAKDLLHDLTRKGHAVMEVRVLDPESLFMVRTK